MTPEANKTVARRFIDEVWNGGDLAVAEELLDPTLVNHDPNGQITNKAGFMNFIRATRAALPAIHFTIDDMIAEGDKVATRVTIRAHQTGSPSSGRSEEWSGIGIIRVANGRIVEQWADTDSIGTAIGLLQSP